MTTFSMTDIGCYLDGARGVYIGEAIQEMAGHLGFRVGRGDSLHGSIAKGGVLYVPCNHDGIHGDGYNTETTCPCPGVNDHDGWYDEVTNEAEDFLNTLTDDNVCFGPTESGDWGLWHICEDELNCTICESL